MLYLIKCEVTQRFHPSGEFIGCDEMNHICEAATKDEAEKKVKNHYSKMSTEGRVSWSASIEYCNEMIS